MIMKVGDLLDGINAVGRNARQLVLVKVTSPTDFDDWQYVYISEVSTDDDGDLILYTTLDNHLT